MFALPLACCLFSTNMVRVFAESISECFKKNMIDNFQQFTSRKLGQTDVPVFEMERNDYIFNLLKIACYSMTWCVDFSHVLLPRSVCLSVTHPLGLSLPPSLSLSLSLTLSLSPPLSLLSLLPPPPPPPLSSLSLFLSFSRTLSLSFSQSLSFVPTHPQSLHIFRTHYLQTTFVKITQEKR